MEVPMNTEAAPRDGPEEQRHEQVSDAHGIGRLAIYAASLSDYNNGILHGAWIDADEDEGRMQSEVDSMLARSPTTKAHGEVAEEWAVHDHQGFQPVRVG